MLADEIMTPLAIDEMVQSPAPDAGAAVSTKKRKASVSGKQEGKPTGPKKPRKSATTAASSATDAKKVATVSTTKAPVSKKPKKVAKKQAVTAALPPTTPVGEAVVPVGPLSGNEDEPADEGQLAKRSELHNKVKEYKKTIYEFLKMMPLLRVTRKQMNTVKVLGRSVPVEKATPEQIETLTSIHQRCVEWRATLDQASILRKLHESKIIQLNKTENKTIKLIFEQKPTPNQTVRVSEMFDKYLNDGLRGSWKTTCRSLLSKNIIYPGFNENKCVRPSRPVRLSSFNIFVCVQWKDDRENLDRIAAEKSREDVMRYLSTTWAAMTAEQKAEYQSMADAQNETTNNSAAAVKSSEDTKKIANEETDDAEEEGEKTEAVDRAQTKNAQTTTSDASYDENPARNKKVLFVVEKASESSKQEID